MIHLKRNWPAKLLSLLAAIVMWFFIMRDQNPVMEVTYTIPVQVQNLNSGYIIEDAPDVVRVVLAGPRDTIMSMKSDTPPAGMNLVEVKPDNIIINVDEYAEKTIPVEIVPIGKFSDDIALKSVTIVPKEVTVSGRKQQVNAVSKVVMKVNVAGQTKNFSAVSTLEAWDTAGNVLDVHINPNQGQAQYELNLLRKEKAVPITVPTVGTVAEGYEVKSTSATPTQLTVTGREEMINSVTEIQTEPIDVSGATETVQGNYNLVLPNGVNSNTTTVRVKVEIQKKVLNG